jgi:hypothetical protein
VKEGFDGGESDVAGAGGISTIGLRCSRKAVTSGAWICSMLKSEGDTLSRSLAKWNSS